MISSSSIPAVNSASDSNTESVVSSSEVSSSENVQAVSSGSLDILGGSEIVSSAVSMPSGSSSIVQNVDPAYASWIEKPLNEYSTTEGLLLLLVIFALLAFIVRLFRSWF